MAPAPTEVTYLPRSSDQKPIRSLPTLASIVIWLATQATVIINIARFTTVGGAVSVRMGCLTITFSAASVLRRCTSYTTFSSVCLSGQSNIHITGLDKGRARPRLCLFLRRLGYLFYQLTLSRTGALQPVNDCCQSS